MPGKISNTKRAIYVFVLMLVSMGLSCTKPALLDIYNNTDEDIILIARPVKRNSEEVKLHLKTHSSARVFFPHHSQGTSVAKMYSFSVEKSGKKLEYHMPFPPKHMAKMKFSSATFFLQIEEDNSIYILEPKHDIPEKHFPKQPDGFPLNPE